MTMPQRTKEPKMVKLNLDLGFEETARTLLASAFQENHEWTEDRVTSFATVVQQLFDDGWFSIIQSLKSMGINDDGIKTTKRFVLLMCWDQVYHELFGGDVTLIDATTGGKSSE